MHIVRSGLLLEWFFACGPRHRGIAAPTHFALIFPSSYTYDDHHPHGKGNVAGHRLAVAGAYVKKPRRRDCVCVYVDVCTRSLHYGH